MKNKIPTKHQQFFQKLIKLCADYQVCIRSGVHGGCFEFWEDMPTSDTITGSYLLDDCAFYGAGKMGGEIQLSLPVNPGKQTSDIIIKTK